MMAGPPDRRDRFRGVLLGTAVGDSVGLPAEGLSPQRAARLMPGRWRQRLFLNSGLISDDTDHTVFVAQSLLAHPSSSSGFQRRLAWCLRLWLLSLPAGVGFATLRAIFRLWLGVSPERSGVHSAGNGPAMRTAPIGAFFAERDDMLNSYVEASTRLTHCDPKALTGALVIARLTAWCLRESLVERPDSQLFLELLRGAGEDREWRALVDDTAEAIGTDQSVRAFAAGLGLSRGVTGYVYHTVPVVVYSWYRHFGDFETTLAAVLNCGGDTDTTGAIAGALAGAAVGHEGIPHDWVSGLRDWPRGQKLLLKIADRLSRASERGADLEQQMQLTASPARHGPVRYAWPAVIPRNLFLLGIVLLHGFRRLAPPY
jgi:ADP-ribosylglycohydrolase